MNSCMKSSDYHIKNSQIQSYIQVHVCKSVMVINLQGVQPQRLKKDVLQQLPAKRRQMIVLDPELVKIDKNLKSSAKLLDSNKIKGSDRHGFLLTYFHDTGQAKVKAVRDYVIDLLESGHKFLVFAHHKEVLDALEEAVRKERYGYIRIDGKTNPEQRNFFCQKFQTRDDVMVAILSITAANAGLNLTSAALVVFAELFWNPGILVQAEDRCHRIGQQDSVNIHYLVARKTADDYIWPLVQKKLSVLGKVGLSKEDFSEADTTVLKDKKQKDILSYFEQSFMEESDISEVQDNVTAHNLTAASSSNQKSEHSGGQRSMLQFVSNGSKESTAKGEQLAAERLKEEGNVMSVEEELTGDWLDELDEEWEEPAEKKVKIAHSER
ncbi:SWI/SNF-related matrix-associated actin-dependent regulator of chromatin subfamily A-like protein 1 isoform X1 [Lingula anatina]|uniref:SWI/SNF-related matrix-associated actin-dependent regulator of chromatin subfamily A-like protein 1 isoform X1 n=2 Tax=Lingula anatina TaxID=7574 RepID=A0A1S3JZJ8_LINAN|nr:SWI/SNF-related matrix-associated actin-dependent regulator of chromatin subfamily A-like protein 1 isoform X1 [Lingula anatina]XP_013415823.1 SWI/SNF-related matrix-associated actin-dependent regulator of chromatin subfamily A-like protein 1 isoform X1 [Lingula anatina]|eukprot:XP_013415822.1 SWI/SNF-related matrix-associated actin-dependent regulator of chromatin subfamily A-like protein 1 isoform X1 [Lingula anatina]